MISSFDVENEENEVRMIELEVQKLELENRLAQLKAEQSIDEECVGCCKVVDVAANLQKDLDEVRGILINKDDVIINLHKTIYDFKTIETQETDRLHKIILDMDVTISDLMDNDRKINGFLDEYRVTVENRDKTIEELKDKNIEDLHELYDLYEEELNQVKSDSVIMLTNYHNVNNRLETTIADLNSQLTERKTDHAAIRTLNQHIISLEAELSARKDDSAVLMKVVEIVKNWDDTTGRAFPTLYKILDKLVDYTDAPEGPPETPIDDLYKVTVSYAFLEMP